MPIEDEKEFRAWLEEQSREVCCAIAFRAAIRVLPLVTGQTNLSKTPEQNVLAVLQALVASGVAALQTSYDADRSSAFGRAQGISSSVRVNTNEALEQAAVEDRDRALYVAAINAANSAGVCAFSTVADAVLDEVDTAGAKGQAVAAAIKAATEISSWNSNGGERFSDAEISGGAAGLIAADNRQSELSRELKVWAEGRSDLLRSGGPWTFWAEWYDRAMAGRFAEQLELYEQIALIPGEIWSPGPEEVALINLKNALAVIVDELCAMEPDAEAECARIAGDNAPIEQTLTREELLSIPEITAPELDTEARGIVESDVEWILADEACMPRWRRIRLANWMTTIWTHWDLDALGFGCIGISSKRASRRQKR